MHTSHSYYQQTMSVSVAPLKKGCFLSLPALIDNCLIAALAAQRYVHKTFLEPQNSNSSSPATSQPVSPSKGSSSSSSSSSGSATPAAPSFVMEKSKLDHHGGSMDLVTQADLSVQDILTAVLHSYEYSSRLPIQKSSSSASAATTAVGDVRLVFVGEEADEGGDPRELQRKASIAVQGKYSLFLKAAEASGVVRHAREHVLDPIREMLEDVQREIDAKRTGNKSNSTTSSNTSSINTSNSASSSTPTGEAASQTDASSSLSSSRRALLKAALLDSYNSSEAATGARGAAEAEYSVFIDPIDATVAFVRGDRRAPMILVGIARNGVPVAGLCLRVFGDLANENNKKGGEETTDANANTNNTKEGAVYQNKGLSLCITGGPNALIWGEPCATVARPLDTPPNEWFPDERQNMDSQQLSSSTVCAAYPASSAEAHKIVNSDENINGHRQNGGSSAGRNGVHPHIQPRPPPPPQHIHVAPNGHTNGNANTKNNKQNGHNGHHHHEYQAAEEEDESNYATRTSHTLQSNNNKQQNQRNNTTTTTTSSSSNNGGNSLSTYISDLQHAEEKLIVAMSGSTTTTKHHGLMESLGPSVLQPARGGGQKAMMVALGAALSHGLFPFQRKQLEAQELLLSANNNTNTSAASSSPQTSPPASSGDAFPADNSPAFSFERNPLVPKELLENAPAHIFPCTIGLKTWDLCAPHAFLRCFGGDLLLLTRGCRSSTLTRSLRYGLPAAALKRLELGMAAPPPKEACFSMIPLMPQTTKDEPQPHVIGLMAVSSLPVLDESVRRVHHDFTLTRNYNGEKFSEQQQRRQQQQSANKAKL